ncbi:hypothetical protein LNP25_21060 [Klebsiella variicola subsp. variicola]|nr:hypothetical protein [Klebsiella variicola subsp. variicola]
MSEPLKPRIDFDGPLQAEIPPLKSARASTPRPTTSRQRGWVTGEEEEGAAGSGGGVGPATQTQPVAADGQRRTGDLRRQRWRKACSGRLSLADPGLIALGGCVAGALIVGAGVGSGGHRVAPSVATAPARPRTR